MQNSNFFHLNNAGLAPLPTPSAETMIYWIRRFQDEGLFCDLDFIAAIEQTRLSLGRVIGCKTTEVGFFQNTASALSQVAFGLTLNAHDQVLIWDQEYPSNFYPWSEACARSGAQLKIAHSTHDLHAPLENLLSQINSRTRVIATSWVQYQTGAVTDLKALVQAARAIRPDIWIVADVIQGLGVRPFDFAQTGLDAVCGGSHKWLCGPLSSGFLAVREERLTDLQPVSVGALTYGTPNDRPKAGTFPRTDGLRFEPGSKSVLDLVGLGASLELLLKTGIGEIENEALRLSDRLSLGLQNLGYALHSTRGPIVNFSREGQLSEIETRLQKNKIGFAKRGPGFRLSPHAFNTDAQIDRVLNLLDI